MSANMERIMRAQALSNKNSNPYMMTALDKRTMEINPSHLIMQKIMNEEDVDNLIDVVYESALLSSGYQVDDINGYLKKVYKYMV